MILSEIYSIVAPRVGLSASDTSHKTKMLNAANGQLKRLFTNLSLISERTSANLTTVDGTDTYMLDSRVLRAINFRETDSPAQLSHMSREEFEKMHPYPASTEEGVPDTYIPLEKVRVTTQPTSASVLSIASDSDSDITSYYVVVRGLVSGIMKAERLLLTGTTAVESSNSYTSLISINKDTTNGTITVTSNSAAVTNISLLPGEKEKEHWKVRLYPIPDDAYTLPYSFQYIPWTLSYAEDVVCIPDAYIEAFLNMVTSQILAEQGDQRFIQYRQEANQLLLEVQDANFMASDDDLRMGFDEIQYRDWE